MQEILIMEIMVKMVAIASLTTSLLLVEVEAVETTYQKMVQMVVRVVEGVCTLPVPEVQEPLGKGMPVEPHQELPAA